ncbi:MAG: hypothetical protein MZV65_33120 [Chromatiales bacterium]|nr:hypothetical protein [Chromatiales bacterium]
MPCAEVDDAGAARARRSAAIVGAQVDLRRACARSPASAGAAAPRRRAAAAPAAGARADLRIGIARDRAFGFYYPDDLDALQAAGAELVLDRHPARRAPAGARRPVHRRRLPRGLHGRDSRPTRRCARRSARAIEAGLPTYAECGGLMYLARSHPLAGPHAHDGRRDPRRRR